MNDNEINDIVFEKIKQYYNKGRNELNEFRENRMITKQEFNSLNDSLNKMEKLITTVMNNVLNNKS